MPITINGDGTITGYTPPIADGSITSAKLADGAASGSKLTHPTGSVIQTISSSKSDVQQLTDTSFIDITGLSATITPHKANSKILILGNLVLHHSQYTAFVQLLRGSTVIGEGSGSNTSHIVYNNENNRNGGRAIMFLDTPSYSLGDSITYKPQIRRDGGSTLYVNAHTTGTINDYISTSYFSVMEIAA